MHDQQTTRTQQLLKSLMTQYADRILMTDVNNAGIVMKQVEYKMMHDLL